MLIPAGTVLNPAHIALAAIAGHDELHVFGKPRVTILLTGAEVVTSGLPGPGQVRDAFGPQLGTVLAMLGGVPAGQRRIGDSYHEWLAALSDTGSRPVERPDVVITTGGTGRSGTDHFRNAIAALGGRLLLDGIAMRPGHPAVLAELPDGRFVIGLPGNPLAAMMALMTIAAPLIAALGHRPRPNLGQVTSGTAIDPDPGRTRLMPFRFDNGLAHPPSTLAGNDEGPRLGRRCPGGASQRRAGRGPGSRAAAPVDPNPDRRIGGKPPVQCLCGSGLGFRETRGSSSLLFRRRKT
ncbi:molybdopterin molybdenumtransferase [Arthrobacter sp. Hiyo8]|nr:molybdopterin molybdenumtransferase [Arthrobacter sp. Hiyo8]